MGNPDGIQERVVLKVLQTLLIIGGVVVEERKEAGVRRRANVEWWNASRETRNKYDDQYIA